MNANWIIRTEKLGKEFRDGDKSLWALKDINLEIQPQAFTVIMGPSGSGKSTLLHLLGGLDRPTEGTIFVNNIINLDSSLTNKSMAGYRSDIIGFIFQAFHLISNMTVLDNVAFPLHLAGYSRQERIERALLILEQVDLSRQANQMINHLSGGEKQRVAIARALVNEPQIILADEPTGNLDTKTGDKVLEILTTLCSKNKTIIMITHDERFKQNATQLFYIKDGKLI